MSSLDLDISTTVLLSVDLQKCYYQPPTTDLFPYLEYNAGRVFNHCREVGVQVVHVRQEDVPGVSRWMPWWQELHPGEDDEHANVGVLEPLDCSKTEGQEQVFIKNTFDGFFETGLHDYLQ